MKTQRIECVTPETVREHMKILAERRNESRRSGSRMGGVSRLAEEVGETSSAISAIIRGVQPPSRKLLDYLGLKRADVYVTTHEAGKPAIS